ncbi:hypothetical protein FRC00_011218 [Tulasnella sp. 408]|nr:hypothetical protein FRC00_011218 [Tulasnella sp. 408]
MFSLFKHFSLFATQTAVLNKGVTLNSNNQVVYGDPGSPIQVEFQFCPTLLGNWPNEDIYVGRILVSSDRLRMDNPGSTAEPYFASVAACSSDTTPVQLKSGRMALVMIVVSFMRASLIRFEYTQKGPDGSDRIGYIPADNTGTPTASAGTHLLEIGCDRQRTNFSIVAQLD